MPGWGRELEATGAAARELQTLGRLAARIDGQYDLVGNAIFTNGDLFIDSVHRFKGRATPTGRG